MSNALKKFYLNLIFLGGLLKSPILLFCRLYWGTLFMLAGWEKFGNIPDFAQLLENYHIHFPVFMAYLVAVTEFVGGFCLLVGFASRLIAIPLIITMLTAYATVHVAAVHSLFQTPSVFIAEGPFNFLLASLLVLAFGPGRFSIDFLLEKCFFSSHAEEVPKHQH